MKPRNKYEAKILGLSQKLPKLNSHQKKWAEELHIAYVTKHYSNLICLECNHSWKNNLPDWTVNVLDHECPKCKLKLTPLPNAVGFSKFETFATISVVEQTQLIRYFSVYKHMSKRNVPKYTICELFQEWNDYTINKRKKNKSNLVVVGLNLSMSWGGDGFQWCSNFDIKDPYDYYGNYRYSITLSDIYPKDIEVLPLIQRNGFKGDFHFCHPRKLFHYITKESIPETLLKLNQTELLSYYVQKSHIGIEKYWKQIKICLKHNYEITDVSMWIDYMDLLQHFNKDINNPIFICPEDFHQAHNIYVDRKRNDDDIERQNNHRLAFERTAEFKRKEAELKERFKHFTLKNKREYFKDFSFSSNTITVFPLLTIDDFKKEGNALSHCVHQNRYDKINHSLIFSARIDNKSVETVQVNIDNFEVLQARGFDNKPTRYHEEIVHIVRKNIPKIKGIVNKMRKDLTTIKEKQNVKRKVVTKHQPLSRAV